MAPSPLMTLHIMWERLLINEAKASGCVQGELRAGMKNALSWLN